jgi:hypothetical protein
VSREAFERSVGLLTEVGLLSSPVAYEDVVDNSVLEAIR